MHLIAVAVRQEVATNSKKRGGALISLRKVPCILHGEGSKETTPPHFTTLMGKILHQISHKVPMQINICLSPPFQGMATDMCISHTRNVA